MQITLQNQVTPLRLLRETRLLRSLSIDQNLMEAIMYLHHEKILVGNITNGERFETYCIPADHGWRNWA